MSPPYPIGSILINRHTGTESVVTAVDSHGDHLLRGWSGMKVRHTECDIEKHWVLASPKPPPAPAAPPEPVDDGGPAFPSAPYETPNHGWQHGYDGMTMRDWFVGQALAGRCGFADATHVTAGGYVAAAYEIADEVMERRGK